MATYGLYSGINEGSLQSAASSIKAKISSARGELESFKGSLTDDMWKASAKQTLITGYDKLSGEVYAEIEQQLDNVDSVCSLIAEYKTAEINAKKCRDQINSGNTGFLNNVQRSLQQYEKQMEECERMISSYCGG